MKKILFAALVLLASCSKEHCPTPEVSIMGNVLTITPAGDYTVEVFGFDNPYQGTYKMTGSSTRVEGGKFKVRVKSECSDWSEWIFKNE